MAAKAGYHKGATPQRVLEILADGARRTVREITIDLRRSSPVKSPYGAAAQALLNLAQRGDVKREQVNRTFVYWREAA